MKLVKLEIDLVRWGAAKGTYEGKVHFEGERGSVGLNLDAGRCQQLFDVCAQGIVDTAKGVARDLTADCIEHAASRSIEVKP